MKSLTQRQGSILEFCRAYLSENDQFPTTRQIQSAFGFASQTAAVSHLRALERKGSIERNQNGKYRFIRAATI